MELAAATLLGLAVHHDPIGEDRLHVATTRRKPRQLEQLAEPDHVPGDLDLTHALTLRHGRDSVRSVTRARWILIALVCASIVAIAIVVAGATGGASEFWSGYEGALGRVQSESWWSLWVLPGLLLALIAALALGIRTSPSWQGSADEAGRRTAFLWSGAAVLVLSVCAPVAVVAQGGLLSAHMLQHVLIGALAPLLILLAIPRAQRGTRQRRPVLAVVLHPLVAFAIWLACTIAWLVPDIHHEVLVRPWVWVLQQAAVFGAGVIMWAPVTDRFVDPPAWFRTGAKCVYMIGIWFAGVGIANVYWFSGTPFYTSHEAGAAAFGFSALQDQANAGTVMILAHCAITFVAIAVLFFRHASERGLEQRLMEAGVPEDEVRRATFDGELVALAARENVSVHTRTGLD
ncbi:MAG: cytochrome c oxidase assembly protein [Actinobacteria bacterium]|nr:cytochrome c oxidase assembly protein [Actinomycetota bacterium]